MERLKVEITEEMLKHYGFEFCEDPDGEDNYYYFLDLFPEKNYYDLGFLVERVEKGKDIWVAKFFPYDEIEIDDLVNLSLVYEKLTGKSLKYRIPT
jgi:hypothetical protein